MTSLQSRRLAAALALAASLPLAAVSARAQNIAAQEQKAPEATIPAPNPPALDPSQSSPTSSSTAPSSATPIPSAKPPAPSSAAAATQSQTPALSQACPGNPDALGTSRVLPIDFGAYQQLGRMQYPDSLPLNDKEVVITFDDGPLPPSTDKVLDVLAAQCVKATFFMVGEMAHSFPATVRRVYEEGHTIGTHSDHHPIGFGKLPLDRMRQEIDGGIADVSAAFGGDPRYLAPFFRIPGFERSDLLESELGPSAG